MDIDQDRSVVTTSSPAPRVVGVAPVAEDRIVVTPTTTVEREVHDVQTRRTVSFPAIAAGALSIAMLVIGGVMMARAGLDDSLKEPVVDVLGATGTAVGGIVLVALGLGLLFAAFSGERGVILFLSTLTGIVATIIAIEPNVADGAIGFSRGFAVLLALAAAGVALAAALTPTVHMSTRRIERI
jgi:hypothetical protein